MEQRTMDKGIRTIDLYVSTGMADATILSLLLTPCSIV